MPRRTSAGPNSKPRWTPQSEFAAAQRGLKEPQPPPSNLGIHGSAYELDQAIEKITNQIAGLAARAKFKPRDILREIERRIGDAPK
jgi:hypothetical protein